MSHKKSDSPSAWQDLRRDWNTLKRLSWKQRLIFLYDYYKWRILVCICTIIAVSTLLSIVWEGQKPCRLRVCVVLNTKDDCRSWFSSFTRDLQSDGKPGAVDIHFDQLFNADSPYHHIQEMEIMVAVSSGRMDVAVCGEELYCYLLALNACLPLENGLSNDLYTALLDSGKLIYGTANLDVDEYGSVDPADGIGGYYAVDLSGCRFAKQYNQTGEDQEPLYMVIIANTEHLEGCEFLLQALMYRES